MHNKGRVRDKGKGQEYEKWDVGFETRKAITRLVMEVLCRGEDVHTGSVRWAAGVVVKWDSGGVWREAFEVMLKYMVCLTLGNFLEEI